MTALRPRLLITLCLFAPGLCGAAELATRPYKDVVHIHRTDHAQDYHLLFIKPRVMEVVGTDPEEAWSVVSEFAKKAGAQIAINANFFSKTESCGVTAGGGHQWTAVYEGCPMTMAFFRNGAISILSSGSAKAVPPGASTSGLVAAVSGRPRLVADGRPAATLERFASIRHPRTALGLRKDGALVILVADGRREAALGFTGPEMSEILIRERVVDAFNLDGGGSTTLYIEGEGGIQNRPSDGHERVVVNQLGFKLKPRKKAAR
ncbi:MAG: phosphodiester glycosidase family protein [Vicinamibacteria bacterium]